MGGGKDSVGGQAFGSWTEQDSQEGFDVSRWATARARALAARVVLPEQIPAMTLDDLVNAFDSIPQATWQLLADRGQLVITASSSPASATSRELEERGQLVHTASSSSDPDGPSQDHSKLPRNNGAGAAK